MLSWRCAQSRTVPGCKSQAGGDEAPPTRAASARGSEQWTWNCDVALAGVRRAQPSRPINAARCRRGPAKKDRASGRLRRVRWPTCTGTGPTAARRRASGACPETGSATRRFSAARLPGRAPRPKPKDAPGAGSAGSCSLRTRRASVAGKRRRLRRNPTRTARARRQGEWTHRQRRGAPQTLHTREEGHSSSARPKTSRTPARKKYRHERIVQLRMARCKMGGGWSRR